jgi:hypothetical protein
VEDCALVVDLMMERNIGSTCRAGGEGEASPRTQESDPGSPAVTAGGPSACCAKVGEAEVAV